MLWASVLTLLTPAAAFFNYNALIVLRVLLGFMLGASWPSIVSTGIPLGCHFLGHLRRQAVSFKEISLNDQEYGSRTFQNDPGIANSIEFFNYSIQ